MKTVIISKNKIDVDRVFPQYIKDKISADFQLLDVAITRQNILRYKGFLADVEFAFSTWGIEDFTKEEIKEYFPNLKGLFYAAGSVRHFAEPFLECDIAVYSAWQANAIPVAEYVYAQILLANKGFFGAARECKSNRNGALKYSNNHGGNYKTTVGLIGCGMIGGIVAKLLFRHDINVVVYDPYLSKETAEDLGVNIALNLSVIFKVCNVISNHLPDKDELKKVINYDMLKLMQSNSTFINTGRGRQVDEKALVRVLRADKSITAILDVTFPEPPKKCSRLNKRKNIILTPHIAGSIGKEVERLADYMIEDCKAVLAGEAGKYRVTLEMLKTMA